MSAREGKNISFKAESKAEMQSWVSAITECIKIASAVCQLIVYYPDCSQPRPPEGPAGGTPASVAASVAKLPSGSRSGTSKPSSSSVPRATTPSIKNESNLYLGSMASRFAVS